MVNTDIICVAQGFHPLYSFRVSGIILMPVLILVTLALFSGDEMSDRWCRPVHSVEADLIGAE